MVLRELEIHLIIHPKGRTSTVVSLIQDFYGHMYKNYIEEIYASDSKNYYFENKTEWVEIAKSDLHRQGKSKQPSRFDILFSIIRNYPKTITFDKKYFKILIIYEADKLERILQQSLRRTIERYNRYCRFILVSKSISHIISPIISRFVLLKFVPLTKKQFLSKLKYICEEEKIKITNEALNLIYYYSADDLGIGINLLQVASVYKDFITDNHIYTIIKMVSPNEIGLSLKAAIKGNIIDARNLLRDLYLKRGYSGKMILRLFHIFLMNSSLSEDIKKDLAIKMADFDNYISRPSTTELQLSYFLSYLATLKISV